MIFEEVTIDLIGSEETPADYFPGKFSRSVILAPGKVFFKDSYHFLAKLFQDIGIGSVCLNSGSAPDLLNAIAFLKSKDTKIISIVGASAGGAGILATFDKSIDPRVDSVVLRAPAGGVPMKNEQVKKLFIVAEGDTISSNTMVKKLFMDSTDPKIYEEISGSDDHAQRLFNSKHKEKIIQMIIDFITNQ